MYRPGDSSGNMCTVTVTVGRAFAVNNRREAILRYSRFKLGMRRKDASINDVRSYSLAGCREVVLTIQWQSTLINAIETPCCIQLR